MDAGTDAGSRPRSLHVLRIAPAKSWRCFAVKCEACSNLIRASASDPHERFELCERGAVNIWELEVWTGPARLGQVRTFVSVWENYTTVDGTTILLIILIRCKTILY